MAVVLAKVDESNLEYARVALFSPTESIEMDLLLLDRYFGKYNSALPKPDAVLLEDERTPACPTV